MITTLLLSSQEITFLFIFGSFRFHSTITGGRCWNITINNRWHCTNTPGWLFTSVVQLWHLLNPVLFIYLFIFFAECLKGFFGEKCSKKCNCTKFETCHAMTGRCKRGRQNEFNFALFQSSNDLLNRRQAPCWVTTPA